MSILCLEDHLTMPDVTETRHCRTRHIYHWYRDHRLPVVSLLESAAPKPSRQISELYFLPCSFRLCWLSSSGISSLLYDALTSTVHELPMSIVVTLRLTSHWLHKHSCNLSLILASDIRLVHWIYRYRGGAGSPFDLRQWNGLRSGPA